MKWFMDAVSSNMLIQGIVFIVLGAFVLFWPGVTITTIIYAFGVLFAVSGVASIISYFIKSSETYKSSAALAAGIFLIALAAVVFLFPKAVASFFSLLLGVVLVLSGIVGAIRALETRKFGGKGWIASLVIGIIVAIGGGIIIANPFDTTIMFIYVLGAIMVLNGVGDLITEWNSRKSRQNRVNAQTKTPTKTNTKTNAHA